MKVGDLLNVDIQGITVTQAIITDMDFDTVTIQIPGTEAVIGLSQSLSDEKPEYVPEVDRVLLDETEGQTKASNETRAPASPPEPTRSLREMNLDSSGID